MRFLGGLLASGLVVSVLVVGCGLEDGGAGDLFAEGDDGGASGNVDSGPGGVTLDGTVLPDGQGGDVTSGGDGANGDDSSTDAPPPADTGGDACGTTEICNNGVDDDCDGKVDCADTQCAPAQGWKCLPAVPAGWSIVAYESNARDTCATGYGPASPTVENPSVPAGACACSSSCTITNPGSCQTGQFKYGIDAPMGATCSITGSLAANNGACTKYGIAWTTNGKSKARVTPAPWDNAGAACSTTQPGAPTVSYAAQGESCALAEATGLGCANNGVCSPTATGFAICIAQGGDQTCPAGFPQKHSVGSGVHGTPTCNNCACTVSATCSNPLETAYTDPGCAPSGNGNTATPLVTDDKCDDVNDGNGQTYAAYTYTATTNAQCATSGGGLNAALALDNAQTICCGP